MGSAMTYTLEQVHSFLLGEAPLDGIWFGENPTHGAMYSWRHHLRKAIQADRAGARVGGWLPIDSAPTIQEGTDAYFWIAVRRAPHERRDDKVYVFPAVYCNRYPVATDDDGICDSSGPFWQQHVLPDGYDGDIALTGWYEVSSDGDYDSNYKPVCSAGDEIVAWHAAPQYPAVKKSLTVVVTQPGDASSEAIVRADGNAPLRDLYRAYVRLLETCRDRIRDLGGGCDPVDVMERNDPALMRARSVLEAAPQPGEVVGEAVAWRWRSDVEVQYNKSWNLTQDAEFVALMIEAGGHIVEPLIIPQPDAARDADAARYRFLRDLGWFEAKYGEFEYSNDVMSERLSKDLDACIDEAMAAGRGEVGNG